MPGLALPNEVSFLLDRLSADLPIILGDELTGIYLYGSLTQNAFNPERSDVDCIIVTKSELSGNQFTDLTAFFEEMIQADRWAMRLQATILIRDEVLKMNSPACLFQFGKLTRSGSDGNPLIWLNVLDTGITLYGKPPGSFVPPITKAMVHEALKREARYIRDEIENPQSTWRDQPKYLAYAVLTLCRILYTDAKGKVVSKPRAAIWSMKKLPDAYHWAICQSLAAKTDRDIGEISHDLMLSFTRYVEGRLG